MKREEGLYYDYITMFSYVPLLPTVNEQPRYKLCGVWLHFPSSALKFTGVYHARG